LEVQIFSFGNLAVVDQPGLNRLRSKAEGLDSNAA